MKTRFAFSLATAASALALMVSPTHARTLDPDIPEDAVEIAKRMQCGVSADEPAVFYWSGNIYGRSPGMRDKLLFKGEGMNIRRCVEVTDAERGTGWRMISREIMLMLDPRTGDVVDRWENPYTGDTVDVMQIHNDPVNGSPTLPRRSDGSAFSLGALREVGPYVFYPVEVPLFYDNPLAGEYQDYVGNKYHAMEIFDFAIPSAELYDSTLPTAYPMISWVRISPWAPWMKMGGRPGEMVFNAMGRKMPGGFDDLPDVLKNEIRANYPIYEFAPPKDDDRENETTWTKFKLLTDAERGEQDEADMPAE